MPPPRPEKDGDRLTIAVKLDDVNYVFHPDEVSAIDVNACRRATGLSVNGIMDAAKRDPDIDIAAAIVWLARRQAGENELPYEVVAHELTYGSNFDVAEVAEKDAADAGEVRAAG